MENIYAKKPIKVTARIENPSHICWLGIGLNKILFNQ